MCITFFVQEYIASQGVKLLQPGRVVVLYISKYRHILAMVLEVVATRIKVLFLCSSEDDEHTNMESLVVESECKMKEVHIFDGFKELHLPNPPLKHAIVTVSSLLLIDITEEIIKVDPKMVISDHERRQIPRFR